MTIRRDKVAKGHCSLPSAAKTQISRSADLAASSGQIKFILYLSGAKGRHMDIATTSLYICGAPTRKEAFSVISGDLVN